MIALIIVVLMLAVLMLAFAILLFPVNITFNSVRSEGTIDGSLGISWIIFLFIYSMKEKELKINILGRCISHHISPEKKRQVKKYKREIKRSRKMTVGKMPHRDLLNMTRSLLRLFKDFIYAFRIKYLDIDATFGLNDPAYTGIITGFLHAIGLSRTEYNIRWRTDFTRQTFDWDIKGQVLRCGWRIMRNQSNV